MLEKEASLFRQELPLVPRGWGGAALSQPRRKWCVCLQGGKASRVLWVKMTWGDRGGALRLRAGRGPAQGGLRWPPQRTGPSVQSGFHRSMEMS